jgi:serine/threonine protein kinase
MGQFYFFTGASTFHTTNESGSHGWIAYECVDWDGLFSDNMQNPLQLRWKEKSDIQVAGMLSFYILTKGKHPFGPKINLLKNLHDDNPVGLSKLSDPVAKDLLSQMLAQDLDKRPYVEQALKHPYFLSTEDQIRFVEALGNEPKLRNSFDAVSIQLDNRDPLKPRSLLLPNDWKIVIGHDDLETLCAGGNNQQCGGRCRSPSDYDGMQYTQCLRLIRNTFMHQYDKPPFQLKKKTLPTSSLEEYFLQLFPTLPLVLHQIIREDPDWKTLPALKDFFPVINRRRHAVCDAD